MVSNLPHGSTKSCMVQTKSHIVQHVSCMVFKPCTSLSRCSQPMRLSLAWFFASRPNLSLQCLSDCPALCLSNAPIFSRMVQLKMRQHSNQQVNLMRVFALTRGVRSYFPNARVA